MAEWTHADLDALAAEVGLPLDRGVRHRQAAAWDWGRIAHGLPAAVARPRTADEVAGLVRFASARGLRLTPRATGASSGGQSVASGSVTIDLSRMDDVGDMAGTAVADGAVACGPGATWRSLLARTLPHGAAPAVMPLQLDLTVGGVVSIGGGSSTSHRYGVAASNVVEAEVVTGTGERLTCSAEERPDLFDAARAGLGRAGVITRMKVRLRPAPPLSRIVRLGYRDMEPFLDDMWAVGRRPDTSQVDGFAYRSPDKADAPFEIHFAVEHEAGAVPEVGALVEGLHHDLVVNTEDTGTGAYAARLDPRFDHMIAAGGAGLAHPWVECLVNRDGLAAVLPDIVKCAPGGPNDRLQIVLMAAGVLPPNMPAPPPGPGDDGMIAFVIAVPVGVEPSDLDQAMAGAREMHDRLLDVGGKRTLSGWIPDTSEAAWRRHFGDRFDGWRAARAAYDPGGTFTSALFAALDT